MINERCQPLQNYLDSSLNDPWFKWVAGPLGLPVPGEFASQEFQDLIGSTGANERTRELEFFRLGLLYGRLVRDRSEPREVKPRGWAQLLQDESPVTPDGYLAALIGRGVSIDPNRRVVKRALNCLSMSLVAAWGLRVGKMVVSPLLLYHYTLREARGEDVLKKQSFDDQLLRRWVAAAVFASLENDVVGPQLVTSYVNGEKPPLLVLRQEDNVSDIPCNLGKICLEVLQGGTGLPGPDSWERKRAPNYWASDRGVYPAGEQLLEAALDQMVTEDRKRLANSGLSVFAEMIESPPSRLMRATHIRRSLLAAGANCEIWEEAMKTIYEGAFEAMSMLKEDLGSKAKTYLFPHNCEGEVGDKGHLRVPVVGTPIPPSAGDFIIHNDYKFKVKSISEEGEDYLIEIENFALAPSA